MDVNIGFIHDREEINITTEGSFKIVSGEETISIVNGKQFHRFSISSGAKTEFEWYEKIDTFYSIEKLKQMRDREYFKDSKVRIEKVGKDFGNGLNNYEYWVLKWIAHPPAGIYKMGDFRFKRIPKKRAKGEIEYNGKIYENRIDLIPMNEESKFYVEDVVVGIGFHWEHKERLSYKGNLGIIVNMDGNLSGVNRIDLEEYLMSVNSSEMRNDNNIEMLKAQTVAARGTVLATMGKHHFGEGFDLCGDDHCQCYQGFSKISDLSREVTLSTKDEVLFFENRVADTRYAKICGGVSEYYSSCWEDMDFSYLRAVYDNRREDYPSGDLREESEAERFILDEGYDCFCNTKNHNLPQSLDFCKPLFRWEFSFTHKDFKRLLKKNLNFEVGKTIDFEVVKRGVSARIVELKIISDKRSITISKELKIRKVFSDSFLPSSAFFIEKNGEITTFKGAGWGHGVGLCQVGAEVMGSKGYNYKEILSHYYRGSKLKKYTIA